MPPRGCHSMADRDQEDAAPKGAPGQRRGEEDHVALAHGMGLMLRALGQLLVRGAVSLGIVAATALCLTGFLSLIATSLQPKTQAVAQTITTGNYRPGHCRPKTSSGRQVVVVKAQ